jgi:GNAT superfamily N-acetyltransferase
MPPEIQIRTFQPGDAPAFRELNESWITRHFRLEPADMEVLADPQAHIIDPGGEILMVVDGDTPIGCCAILDEGHGLFELGKMTIRDDYRGRGLGRKLLLAAIDEARRKHAHSLYLLTNDKLGDAVHLYESVGFRHVAPDQIPPSPYERGNVCMLLPLA